MGRILITGAAGNVGKYVAQYALENDREITVAGTHTETLGRMFTGKVRVVSFDFMDSSTFPAALENVDRVFLMRPPHLGKPGDLKPFIDAMREQGGIRLVCFLSLIGAEHNPFPPHHKIEKFIEQANLPYCHIRPSFFMQNISGIHAFEVRHFNRLVVPAGNAVTSFIDAEDIGELTAAVLCKPDAHRNKAYSITGAKAIDYWEAAEILSEELGREILCANPEPALAVKYWITVRGLEKEYCNVMCMLYRLTRLGAAKTVTSVFEMIMGRKPRSFRDFVIKNLPAWKLDTDRRDTECP